jgi:hypothetical protein
MSWCVPLASRRQMESIIILNFVRASQTTANGGADIISDRAYGMLIAYSEAARLVYPDIENTKSTVVANVINSMRLFGERTANMSAALKSFLEADTTKTELTDLFERYVVSIHPKTVVSNDVYVMPAWDNYVGKVSGLCDNVYNVSAIL